ncbi:choline-sulfatase [Candidatus Poribacteria bacterium]|jgi:choline-sulfatase|nr:choline-sulfatase [Candidatus Poribacteria bacterium]MBT5537014.1 choline-sulfatase [Candidatus Poribacteria bacterium]MBT5711319.1 choline-sulfatase [Candidatus Poribacteria bacterium]MBT7804992.1 choline-sulfatase [Candidatus Poribacteria bacterium]
MSDQPNILLIVSDQMTAALTGVYGHPVVQTPHLERLAEDGVRFDSAYTPFPLCSPGRACMMTGRHASEIGAWDNGALLAADQVTFAHYLSNAGYDTVLSGKMHFVGPDQLHGFQRRLTTDIYSCHFDWVKPEWIRIKEMQGRDCEEVMGDRSSYNARGYTGEAVRVGVWHNALSYDEETHFRSVEYLRSKARRPEAGPFMLCASYHHPHEPFLPPQEYWDLYDGAEIDTPEFPTNLDDTYSLLDRNLNAYHGTRRVNLRDEDGLRRLRRAYYALVTYMDRKVGALLDTLDETGLADNTVVVFASDHGDMLCEKEMVQKRTFYEWSCRVPLLARFPDGWKAGTVCDAPVSLLDLLPTFCELAGEDAALPHDGHSLIAAAEDGAPDRYVFAQAHEAVGMPCIMARKGRYKYNYIHGDEDQLLDLDADPGEWNDLSRDPAHANVAAEMRGVILGRFDPDRMARENLDSLYRRRHIRDAMKANGTDWTHHPRFDARRGALDQYLP